LQSVFAPKKLDRYGAGLGIIKGAVKVLLPPINPLLPHDFYRVAYKVYLEREWIRAPAGVI